MCYFLALGQACNFCQNFVQAKSKRPFSSPEAALEPSCLSSKKGRSGEGVAQTLVSKWKTGAYFACPFQAN
jgi:hypothetical protein